MWSIPLPILALASTHSLTPYNRLLSKHSFEVTVVNVWFQAHILELQTAHGPPHQQQCHVLLENLFEMQTLGPQPDNSDTLGVGPGVHASASLPGACDVFRPENSGSLHPGTSRLHLDRGLWRPHAGSAVSIWSHCSDHTQNFKHNSPGVRNRAHWVRVWEITSEPADQHRNNTSPQERPC